MELVKIENIIKEYTLPRQHLFKKAPLLRALNNVSLQIYKGDSYGIVGESGCGKSTLARIIMALDNPSSGTVYYKGRDLFSIPPHDLRHLRKHFQMIFQDPYSSLNPRKKIVSIVSEPLDMLEKNISYKERKNRVASMLKEVGMKTDDMNKYPHEFSGGQRQRIAIARALITNPSMIVADEAVSALDVSIQAQVLNLMMDLQEKYSLTFVFISHDLGVVEYITRKIAVIYLGKIVEQGSTEEIFKNPLHPYTHMLLKAIPDINPEKKKNRKKTIPGKPGTENSCPFIDRCSLATQLCVLQSPGLVEIEKGHKAACHNVYSV